MSLNTYVNVTFYTLRGLREDPIASLSCKMRFYKKIAKKHLFVELRIRFFSTYCEYFSNSITLKV